jgi:hypothetical protein
MHLFDTIPRVKQEHGAFFMVDTIRVIPRRLRFRRG